MSENLNRSQGSFSKYDSMSIEELETVLRADAEVPDGQESDVDEILYVMEVLASRRRNNGIAGKTALEAYESFKQHYLPIEEKNIESVSDQKPRKVILFRRLSSVAATLAIIISLSVTANAFGWRDIWGVVAEWAKETFHFSSGLVEITEPVVSDNQEYSSFQEYLKQYKVNPSVIPTWIPHGYVLSDIISDENPRQKTYIAVYTCEEKTMKITVQSYLSDRPEHIEINDNLIDVYSASGTDYYFLQNNELTQAIWIVDSYECYIAGKLTVEEIKLMIDSIRKG